MLPSNCKSLRPTECPLPDTIPASSSAADRNLSTTDSTGNQPSRRFLSVRRAWQVWVGVPLYLRIVCAMLLGAAFGLLLGDRARVFRLPADLIIRMLAALAAPLILIAIVQALLGARVQGRMAIRMAFLLALNTTVAILIGLAVANIVRPGERVPAHALRPPPPGVTPTPPKTPLDSFLDQLVPDSLARPLIDNNVLGIISIAVVFGIALRSRRDKPLQTIGDIVDIAFDTIVQVLHWVIALVPIAVFGMVAATIGANGFSPFVALGAFVGAVVLGLTLQALWYLSRIMMGTWVHPVRLLRGTRDALLTAFSTDSSTATMAVNYVCLRDNVGLRDESARIGALIGTNFNNDGTALYEAMSALFVAQLIGRHLTIGQQVVVMLMSIVASVGAAGIPEAGTVTMLLVLNAVGLPTEYVALLLTVDWFLDRCRTTVNIMGDMNVACMLDGRIQARSVTIHSGAAHEREAGTG